ncbi:MAG: hypothetical protein Q8O75_01360, partial [bacterium]|nr:hypothetical protein [bacterium]
GQAINKPVEAGAQTTVNTLFAKTAPSSVPSLETTHTELEKVKEFARQELARRGGLVQRPQISTAPETISTQPVGQITTVDQTRQSPLPEAPPTPIIPPAESDDETRRILSEASELETQLAELSNVIASQPKEADISINPVPNAPIPATPTIDEHNDQINRLVTDKTSLLRQLNEMTASYNQGGQEKQSLETKLKTITDDYERRLQQAQIEKTNLLAQFKNLEEKMTEISGKQTENESTLNNVSELKARLSAVEKERNEVADRAQKLEALVNALQSVPKTVAEPPKTVVAPTQAEPGRETPSSARIVSAQIATGKMAPSLTTTPNVINGVTKDTGGLLLYNVIIVVKDATGQPVRALKTNKIGQFAISTPLPNDTYTMELESPGHTFDIVQIELDGKVLPPIEIRATS